MRHFEARRGIPTTQARRQFWAFCPLYSGLFVRRGVLAFSLQCPNWVSSVYRIGAVREPALFYQSALIYLNGLDGAAQPHLLVFPAAIIISRSWEETAADT